MFYKHIKTFKTILAALGISTALMANGMDENRIIKSFDLVPEGKYELSALLDPQKENIKIVPEISFFNDSMQLINKCEISNYTLKNTEQSQKKLSFIFEVPALAAACELRLKTETPSSVPDWTNINITRLPIQIKKPYGYYWQAVWIWDSKPPKAQSYRYFRKTFEIPEDKQVESAVFQWAADNGAEIFINGNSIGKVSTWAIPVVKPVREFLKAGKNTIAAKAFCHSGGAAFLGELNVNFKDGQTMTVASAPSWKVSAAEVTQWTGEAFDDSSWENAFLKCVPPQTPYGKLPYHYSGHIFNIKTLGTNLPEKIKGGDSLSLQIKCLANQKLPEENLTIEFRKNGLSYFDRQIKFIPSAQKPEKEFSINTDIEIPRYIVDGKYDIYIKSQSFLFGNNNLIASVNISQDENLKKQPDTVAEILRVKNAPRLCINGEVKPLFTYKSAINARDDNDYFRYMKDFEKSGVILQELTIYLYRIWDKDGKLNTDKIDSAIIAALYNAPGSYLLLNIGMDAPKWWLEKHPEERVRFVDKAYNEVSFASQKWKEESSKVLEELITYICSRVYSQKLIGFYLWGGEDGQWMHWTVREGLNLSGYSSSMRLYFQNWLRSKYTDITNLNRAWNTSLTEFSSIEVPSPAARSISADGVFYNPQKSMKVIDFQQAFSDSVTDILLQYAAIIKKITHRNKIVGTYYGKIFSIAGYHEFGEFGTYRLINSPDLDIFTGVEYFQRAPGLPNSVSAPLTSLRLHDKLFMDEADLRTFVGGAKNWGYTGNLWDTVSVIRKMFAFDFVQNHGIHWFDLHGGEFESESIMKAISDTAKIADKIKLAPPLKAEIAVFVDEKSLTYTSPEIKAITRQNIQHQANGIFYRTGTNCDMYFLEDIASEEFPEYKVYIFLNAWCVDGKLKEKINALKKNNAAFVWLYSSGLISDNMMSVKNVSELTGIEMNIIEKPVPFFAEIKASEKGLDILKNVNINSYIGNIGPIVYPVDNSSVLFGKICKNENYPAGAYKAFNTWKSLYFSSPVINAELIRNIARDAGCFIYNDDPENMLYIGSELFAIHTSEKGKKIIRFPENNTFTDAISGDVVATNTNRLEIEMEKNETKIFYRQQVPEKKSFWEWLW